MECDLEVGVASAGSEGIKLISGDEEVLFIYPSIRDNACLFNKYPYLARGEGCISDILVV